jgi:hypothetical protein
LLAGGTRLIREPPGHQRVQQRRYGRLGIAAVGREERF